MKHLSVVLSLIFIAIAQNGQCQKLTHANDYTSFYIVDSQTRNNFLVSVSLVAMFTSGVADRNGFRLGAGINASQKVGNWTFSTGVDTYKAVAKFGVATSFVGISYDDGKYGASYYANKYYQGDKQISGMIGLHLSDFGLRFEDDVLASPFTAFKIYDRYRTAAIEIQYKHFVAGMNVYTTESNGLTDISYQNSQGLYCTGKQVSSPIYIGYTNKNLIARYGLNTQLGGNIGQNWWHRKLFDTSDFKAEKYQSHFFQIGTNKSYTLY